jgi:RNA polymerase sigma-70 factor (ECF subfamily)
MAPLAAAAFSEFAPAARPHAAPSFAAPEPRRAGRSHLAVVPTPAEPVLAFPRASAAELYRLHGPVVYRRCLRLLKNAEAARDATQEVFLRLVRADATLLDREDLVPWLYRVATNYCLNLRREARHHGETTLDDAPELAREHGDGLDAILVQRLLARFDAVTQAIAVAILVEEQEHEEVAAALGLSRRTMARKLERFIELARRHLVLTGDAAASSGPRH